MDQFGRVPGRFASVASRFVNSGVRDSNSQSFPGSLHLAEAMPRGVSVRGLLRPKTEGLFLACTPGCVNKKHAFGRRVESLRRFWTKRICPGSAKRHRIPLEKKRAGPKPRPTADSKRVDSYGVPVQPGMIRATPAPLASLPPASTLPAARSYSQSPLSLSPLPPLELSLSW